MSTSPTGFITVPKGLAKVVVTDTELGDVRGDEGFFHYRQYSAVELAEQVGFEQAWHLLERGHLPDDAELAAFTAEVGRLRVLPPGLADLLPAICATTTDSLQVLRTTLSAWGGIAGLRPLYDCDEDEKAATALAAVAVTPTILAAAHRLHHGLEPVPADPTLGHAEDYLRMVTGRLPSARDARAVEQYLVATMDHGFNASTFTARVVASTGADLAACLVAAIGSFSGPKPGGELHANVEFYAGVVMRLAGLEPSMFTPTFCVARVVGWTANVLEQSRDPKIIRPAARYVGPPPPQPVPAARRAPQPA